MNTKKEIVDFTYYLLWEDQSSTVFDKEGKVVPKIKSIIDQICRCNITNIITQQKIRGWVLDFLYKEETIKIPKVKKTLEEIDINTQYILLDSVDWLPTRWYLELDWNIISYNWLSLENNALLKVSWINGYHDASSTVHFAYLLPETLIKTTDFYDVTYKEMLEFIDFRDERLNFERCYTIKPYKWRKVAIFYNINAPVQSAVCKLYPPVKQSTSSTSPEKYKPGTSLDSNVFGLTSFVDTPPEVTTALSISSKPI